MRLLACLLLPAALLFTAEAQTQTFDQAVKALSSGDYGAAEEGFQKVLSASPEHVGALQNLGLVYSRTERFDLAIATYRRALALNPNHKGLLMNLGLAYVQQENYGSALPVFQTLVKADPGSLPARELLATSEYYTGHLTSASARFEALRPEDPDNADLLYLLSAVYLKQNQMEKMQYALGQAPKSWPAAQISFIQCRAYADSGRTEEAIEHCRKTLALDTNFAGAHREMGKVLATERDPSAIAELTAAIREDPRDAEALYSLGVAQLQENRIEEAAQSLERARRLRPGFWGNYYYLGKTQLQMGQAGQAIPLLQKAAELNPRASVLFYELGRALKATGRAAESERAMDRVRELRVAELENDVKALQKR